MGREIDDRESFLDDMRRMGEGRVYEAQIKSEISDVFLKFKMTSLCCVKNIRNCSWFQRLHEMRLLDKRITESSSILSAPEQSNSTSVVRSSTEQRAPPLASPLARRLAVERAMRRNFDSGF